MAATAGINLIDGRYAKWTPGGIFRTPQTTTEPPSAVMPVDRVSLSAQALKEKSDHSGRETAIKGNQELSAEEKQQTERLKRRDAEVKAHEQAHMAAGGGVVQGGASYQYETGPDGKNYAVGGEVKIDTSPERTPEATIRKMQQVRRAALAPAKPSATDRAVAAQAAQVETQARSEKAKQDQQPDANPDAIALVQSRSNPPNSRDPEADVGRQINLTI